MDSGKFITTIISGILPAVISGLFAFGGAYLAIRSQRQLTRDNWLLQRRSEVFSQFLTDFLEYRTDTTFGYDEKELCVAQEKIYTSANKVSLYLSKGSRKDFKDTFEEYMRFKPDTSESINIEAIAKSYAPQFDLERRFQEIFENALSEKL